jgi:hypothetical protein
MEIRLQHLYLLKKNEIMLVKAWLISYGAKSNIHGNNRHERNYN